MKKLQKIHALGMSGASSYLISIETSVKRGLFHFDIIGLANKSISESRQRVLSAIQHCDPEAVRYTDKKIVTLLSPSDIRKEGAHLDLPIAISYICTSKKYELSTSSNEHEALDKTIFLGELSLTGSIRDTEQITPCLISAITSNIDFNRVVLPRTSFEKLKILDITQFQPEHSEKIQTRLSNLLFWPIENLGEFYKAAKSSNVLNSISTKLEQNLVGNHDETTESKKADIEHEENIPNSKFLIDSIQGNESAKRALLVALAGNHHIVFSGHPGTGKSLLAKSADDLRYKGQLYDSAIKSSSELSNDKNKTHVSYKNNFRQPHHSATIREILGDQKRVGEIAKAHKGVLFLDEMIEYNRRVIESLRQSIEYGFYQDTKGQLRNSEYILIGTMNPCGCGYYGSKQRRCVCARAQIERYERKIRSPLFERIDIFVSVTNTTLHTSFSESYLSGKSIREIIKQVQLLSEANTKSSQNLKQKIEHIEHIEKHLSNESLRIYTEIKLNYLSNSKRWFSSLLKIADTISKIEFCLQNCDEIEISPDHILEALSYKQKIT